MISIHKQGALLQKSTLFYVNMNAEPSYCTSTTLVERDNNKSLIFKYFVLLYYDIEFRHNHVKVLCAIICRAAVKRLLT